MEPTGNASDNAAKLAASGNQRTRTGTFVLNGEYWTIGCGGTNFALRNILGLGYIHRLLQHAGEEFHALDLETGSPSSTALSAAKPGAATSVNEADLVPRRCGDTGPMLDAQAKQEYRRRILQLKEELDELREKGDYERGAKLESEIDFITRQLAQAVGFGGRDRRAGSAAERARINVSRAIRAAIQKIAEHNPLLGQFLRDHVKTGSFCSYLPNPRVPIDWTLTAKAVEAAPISQTPATTPFATVTSFTHATAYRTRFVGREEERAILRRYMEQAKRGEGQIVIVSGPPGIGKTRLSREAGEEARRQGFTALAGNCYEREDSLPSVPFVELLEAPLARIPSPTAMDEMLGRKAAELTRLLPQLHRLLPDIPAGSQVSREQGRRLLFNAVLQLVARQCAARPLLLQLEDLHWADEGTLSLLLHLGRSISKMPVMVIGTHRDADVDMKPPLTHALDEFIRLRVMQRLQLRGLPQLAVAQMIEAWSGREPSPALVDLIYSNSDGNPLFVEELIEHLERVRTNADSLELLEQGGIAVPHKLRLVINRRLALVSKETIKILGTAAVIGRSFTFGLLQAATHADPDRLVDSVEEAEKAGLISSRLQYPEARFRFSHELIRRAVFDRVSLARRQRLHLNLHSLVVSKLMFGGDRNR